MHIGCSVKTRTNQGYVTEFLGAGGEGSSWKIKTSTGFDVVKVFHDKFNWSETAKRVKYLENLQLEELSSVFKAPKELYRHKREIGYTSSFAHGITLDKYLEHPTGTFADNVVLAISLAYGLHLLHECGVAHGDIHTGNFLVDYFHGMHKLYFVDLDNFNASKVPKPRMLGNLLYIAPELRIGYHAGVKLYPNILCDLYSAGLIIHELLLMHYPQHIIEKLETEYPELINESNRDNEKQQGFSENILNPELRRLLHLSLSDDPKERPTKKKWLDALLDALYKIHQCDYCDMPFINDSSKFRCPSCSREFPLLKLILDNGREILLDKNGKSILGKHIGTGRDNSEWGTLQRFGCETSLIPSDRNSVFYWSKDGWMRLRPGESFLLKPGGRFLFGGVEGVVVECK